MRCAVGNDWLLASLWLQQVFAAHGRYRSLTRLRLHEARGPPLLPPPAPPPASPPGSDAAPPPPHAALRAQELRARFERGVAARAMDGLRLLQGLRVLQPKARASRSRVREEPTAAAVRAEPTAATEGARLLMTYCPRPTAHRPLPPAPCPLPPAPCPLPPAPCPLPTAHCHCPLPTHEPPQVRTSFSEATRAYTSFAAAFNRNRLVDSWPLLAELHWGLLMVSSRSGSSGSSGSSGGSSSSSSSSS